jgi:hypothetical protein
MIWLMYNVPHKAASQHTRPKKFWAWGSPVDFYSSFWGFHVNRTPRVDDRNIGCVSCVNRILGIICCIVTAIVPSTVDFST